MEQCNTNSPPFLNNRITAHISLKKGVHHVGAYLRLKINIWRGLRYRGY